jgi:hypothetical protein
MTTFQTISAEQIPKLPAVKVTDEEYVRLARGHDGFHRLNQH